MISKTEKLFLFLARVLNILSIITFLICLSCSITDFWDLTLDWFIYYPWAVLFMFLLARYIGYFVFKWGIYIDVKLKGRSMLYWRQYVPWVFFLLIVVSVFWGKKDIYNGLLILWLNGGVFLYVKKHGDKIWGKITD